MLGAGLDRRHHHQHCSDHHVDSRYGAGVCPQIVVTFVVFLIVFPWMMGTMVSYTHNLLASFEPYREMTHCVLTC